MCKSISHMLNYIAFIRHRITINECPLCAGKSGTNVVNKDLLVSARKHEVGDIE